MFLGTKQHTTGNKIRYFVDYSNWLETGETLSPAGNTVTMDPLTATVTDITISGLQVTPTELIFFVAGGTLNEEFTLDVHAETSRGEKKNDTLAFTVTAP